MSTLTPAALLEQLTWRYATKRFDAARKIPTQAWNALEQSLVLTPSSFGLQPWRFLVIQDPALRQKLLPLSWGQTQVVEASHFVVFTALKKVDPTHVRRFIELTAQTRQTPVEALKGYQDLMTGFVSRPETAFNAQEWAARQVYIALGQFMATCAMLGIDACPMEGIDPAKYDEVLSLPQDGYATVVACAVGYRAPDDKYASAAKVRFPVGELIQHR